MHIPGRARWCAKTARLCAVDGYCGSGVSWEKSGERHLAKWTRNLTATAPSKTGKNTQLPCRNCDLIIHGLGWISARKGEYKLKGYLQRALSFPCAPASLGQNSNNLE